MKKREQIFTKIQQGESSLMVWGGFGYGDNLAFLSSHIKANNYQKMLENHLLPLANRIVILCSIFQQDKIFILAVKFFWEWFLDNCVQCHWIACPFLLISIFNKMCEVSSVGQCVPMSDVSVCGKIEVCHQWSMG